MKKVRVYLLLFVALLALGGAVWAFWVAGIRVNTEDDRTINITVGTADYVDTTVVIGGDVDEILVPVGQSDYAVENAAVEIVIIPVTLLWEVDEESTWSDSWLDVTAQFEISVTFCADVVGLGVPVSSLFRSKVFTTTDLAGLEAELDAGTFADATEKFNAIGEFGDVAVITHAPLLLNSEVAFEFFIAVFICVPTSIAHAQQIIGLGSFEVIVSVSYDEALTGRPYIVDVSS